MCLQWAVDVISIGTTSSNRLETLLANPWCDMSRHATKIERHLLIKWCGRCIPSRLQQCIWIFAVRPISPMVVWCLGCWTTVGCKATWRALLVQGFRMARTKGQCTASRSRQAKLSWWAAITGKERTSCFLRSSQRHQAVKFSLRDSLRHFEVGLSSETTGLPNSQLPRHLPWRHHLRIDIICDKMKSMTGHLCSTLYKAETVSFHVDTVNLMICSFSSLAPKTVQSNRRNCRVCMHEKPRGPRLSKSSIDERILPVYTWEWSNTRSSFLSTHYQSLKWLACGNFIQRIPLCHQENVANLCHGGLDCPGSVNISALQV